MSGFSSRPYAKQTLQRFAGQLIATRITADSFHPLL